MIWVEAQPMAQALRRRRGPGVRREFGAFLLLFLLLRELLRKAEVFFGVRFARCGECLRGLMAGLGKQAALYADVVCQRVSAA